jgi:uncharacterized protein (TIGR03067 family)
MSRVLLSVLLLVGLGADAKEDAAKKDLEAMQGTWTIEHLEIGGKKVPDESVKAAGSRVVFKDTTMTVYLHGDNKKPAYEATIQLDPTTKPPSIDTTDDKKQVEHGIYELSGETLKLCTAPPGADRPKEFNSKLTAKTALWVLKKVQ